MSETVIHSAEEAPAAVATELAQTVGETAAHVEHAGDAIEDHGERLTNIESDVSWLKQNATETASALADLPDKVLTTVRSETADALQALTEHFQTEPESMSQAEHGETTKPPPERPNEAKSNEPTGFLAGLRKQLHRLL